MFLNIFTTVLYCNTVQCFECSERKCGTHEDSVMYSVCFFVGVFALIDTNKSSLTRMLFHLTTRGGVRFN